MHYYVVGVNGSGKSTLLRHVQTLTGIATIPGTAALMEHLGIPGDYDALRAMDQGSVLQKWQETAEQLATKPESFTLDTHLMNLTRGKIIRRDGAWIAEYDALVLITADPEVILDRVTQDTDRDRALFPEEWSHAQKLAMITAYQQQTKELCAELAARYNLPSIVIVNDDLDSAAAAFKAFDAKLQEKHHG